MHNDNDWDKPEEFGEWLDPYEPEFFEDIDDMMCQCCGEIVERIMVLEDTDFPSFVNVCEACKLDLMNEEPGRWREIDGGLTN